MVSFISRAIGATTVLGFAAYGFKTAMGNVMDWKNSHDLIVYNTRNTAVTPHI